MIGDVKRENQVDPEDSSSEGLDLLARIIAGNILREKENKKNRALDTPDKPENKNKKKQ